MEGMDDPVDVCSMASACDMKFCKNCKKDIAAANFTVHELHCVRHIKLCPHCNEPIAKNSFDEHFADVHATVECPHCIMKVAKSELDRHLADSHAKVPCPNCREDIDRNGLSEHLEYAHTTVPCPLCNSTIVKNQLDNHQLAECNKRRVTCRFCDMVCLCSELPGHEDYCGSRTEPCTDCGNYIMVREAKLHADTKCQWPEIQQKNNNRRTDERFEWPVHVDSMEHLFARRTQFGDHHYELRHPPPSYYQHNVVDSPHDLDHHFCDLDELPSEDGDNCLPCEFCGRLCSTQTLRQHQTICSVTYRHRQHSSPSDHYSECAKAKVKIPLYPDDTSPIDISDEECEDELTHDHYSADAAVEDVSTRMRSTDAFDSSDQVSLIPCEFCSKMFSQELLLGHQENCLSRTDRRHRRDKLRNHVPLSSREPVMSDCRGPIPINRDVDGDGEDLRRGISKELNGAIAGRRNMQHLRSGESSAPVSNPAEEQVSLIPCEEQVSLIPCEFCSKLFEPLSVHEHQTRCARMYEVNWAHQQPVVVSEVQDQLTSSFNSAHVDSDADSDDDVQIIDTVSSDAYHYPLVRHSSMEKLSSLLSKESPIAGVGNANEMSLIPCEFCLEQFDREVIAEHQERCFQEQKDELNAILASQTQPTAANRYRYPYSVMSLETREKLLHHDLCHQQEDEDDPDHLYD